MDWTWRLDTVVPAALEVAVIAGGALALLAWLAGGLSLLGRRAVRLAMRLVVLLALGLVLAGYEDAAMIAAAVAFVAGLGAVSVSAILLVARRVRTPAWRAALAAGAVLLWDGMHASPRADGPTAVLLLVGVLGLVVLAAYAALRRWGRARSLAVAWAVWALVVVGFSAWSRLNLRLATDRAHTVIAACRRFEADHRRLPGSLEELVPAYLPQVPRANWTILGHFVYEAERGALSYLDPWPFEQTYFFASDHWDWHRLYGRDDDDGRGADSDDATERDA